MHISGVRYLESALLLARLYLYKEACPVESPEVNFNYRTGHALAACYVGLRFAAAFLVGKFGRLYL